MSKTENSSKLMFVTYAYAMGTILVVLGHSTPTGASDMPMVVERIREFVYCFHMPLFFFIAGFLLKFTSDKHKKPYGQFIKNKSVKFLTPYIVLSVVAMVPKVLLSNYVDDEVGFDLYHILESFFAPRLNIWGHFWFLPTLLTMFAVSYLILACYKNRVVYSLVMIVTFGLALFQINTQWFAVKDICQQLIFFCAGIASANLIIKKREELFRLPVAVATTAVAILCYVVVCWLKGIIVVNTQLYWMFKFWIVNLTLCNIIINFLTVLTGLFMIYTVLYFSFLLERKGCRPLKYLDGKTFSIYIMSWPCQAAVEVVLNRYLHLHWYYTMPAMFIVGLGVPLLVLFIYKKFKHHPKFINLVFGVN